MYLIIDQFESVRPNDYHKPTIFSFVPQRANLEFNCKQYAVY